MFFLVFLSAMFVCSAVTYVLARRHAAQQANATLHVVGVMTGAVAVAVMLTIPVLYQLYVLAGPLFSMPLRFLHFALIIAWVIVATYGVGMPGHGLARFAPGVALLATIVLLFMMVRLSVRPLPVDLWVSGNWLLFLVSVWLFLRSLRLTHAKN